MSLLLRTHIDLAKSSLRRNRTRSFLTCLGIAIGVASIILILSLTGSINRLIASQVKSAGTDLIVVRPTAQQDSLSNLVTELTTTNQFTKSHLSLADVTAIQELDHVTAAAPIAISYNTLVGEHTIDAATILGTNEDFQAIANLSLRSGSFILTEDDPNFTAHPAVIGRDLSLSLFGTTSSIGETFTLQDERYLIIGILEQIDDPINFNNVDLDHAVIISADYLKQLDDNLQIQQINVKIDASDAVPTTAEAITSALARTKSGNFTVSYGDAISHPSSTLFNVVSSMLTIVACVSLVVGGVGVMNIMLVSVTERTHEIGIRKAVGATNTNIFLQFLFESLILCFLGGVLGLILGYILAFLVSVFTPFAPFISWQILLAVLYVSVIVGTVFGLYPSLKAAHQDPIESLKSY